MKNLYFFLLILAQTACLANVSHVFSENLAIDMQQQDLPQSLANAYYSVPLTGFNHDVIANGNGEANTTTSTTIDFSNDYFSADFVPTTPYAGVVSGAVYGGGLPASGQVSSAVTAGLTYQLADYSTSNALLIRPLTSATGTLSFATTYTANTVYILWVATESQANTVGVTIHFGDGTTQVASNQIAYDWVGGSTAIALSGLSRVGNGSTQWAGLNEFSESGACKLFEEKIDILPANQAKEITGISFSYAPAGNYQSLVVFAVNVFGEPLSVRENRRNAVSVYPNPSADIFRVSASQEVKTLSVMNSLGQEVKRIAGNEVSLSGMSQGIYFLKISFGDDTAEVRRLIKK